MDEMIVVSDDECYLQIQNCNSKFKEWYKKNYEGQKIPPQKELKKNMEKK